MPKPDKISLDPATMSETDVYKIVARCIVPRPIGFVRRSASAEYRTLPDNSGPKDTLANRRRPTRREPVGPPDRRRYPLTPDG
jgi:hypothetical protein